MAREPSNALITIFIVMHTFGWTGSSLILLTVLCSTKVSRCLTWFNLNFSWIVACLSFSLLFITGQLGKSSPDAGVCLMQASAVSAAPTLTAGATLAFVIFLFFELRSRGIEGATFSILLISLPYLFPTIIFSLALVHGIRHPRSVILSESKMFCTIDYRILDKAATIFTCTIMLPTLTLNIVIGFLVQQYWRILPRDKRNGVLSSCVRLAIFTVFSLVGVVINVMFLTGLDWGAWSGLPNLLISLASVSYVAVFGSQRDLLEVWFPCIRNHKDNKVVEPPPSTTSWVQLIPTNFVHGHNGPRALFDAKPILRPISALQVPV